MGMDQFVIVPQPASASGFLKLSRDRQGRLFEKHILTFGDLLYPGVKGGKVKIDQAFADKLIQNFEDGVCDIVQVPLAGEQNQHSEDPLRNLGEVVGIRVRDKKIYAVVDVRDESAVPKMGKTLLGASAMLHLNYRDTRTGKLVGPTLLHVAVTNRPYIPMLEDYQEIIAATAQGADGVSKAVLLTASTEEESMTRDEMIAALKADHGIDVATLQAQSAVVDSAVELTNAVQEALTETGMLKLSNSEPTADDMVKAIKDAGEKIVTLTNDAAKKDAEAHVDELVRTGHILPAHRDAQVELRLSNPELFEKLLPEQPIVKLSNESGSNEEPPAVDDVSAEVERLTKSPAAVPYIH